MSTGKVFCEECRKDVEYTVRDKEMKTVLKGEAYRYSGKEAHCTSCGSEIYVDYINDLNLKSLYDEYRNKNDIIPLEKILKINQKYNIGRRPLSLLLGWGEHTFSRYCDGDIPTRQYSDILKKIYEEPEFYNQILEENKDNLKSESAYRKSKTVVNKLLGDLSEENPKINLVVGYLLNQCEDITPLALQKSLYYIQGFHYAFYNKFLFSEDCQAWVHGPVYPGIYARYKDYRFEPIDRIKDFDRTVFLSSEVAVIDSVIKNICCYSGKILEKFTHSESPWLSARGDLPEGVFSDEVIKREDIGKYFMSIKEKYGMINPGDIRSYSETMFSRI